MCLCVHFRNYLKTSIWTLSWLWFSEVLFEENRIVIIASLRRSKTWSALWSPGLFHIWRHDLPHNFHRNHHTCIYPRIKERLGLVCASRYLVVLSYHPLKKWCQRDSTVNYASRFQGPNSVEQKMPASVKGAISQDLKNKASHSPKCRKELFTFKRWHSQPVSPLTVILPPTTAFEI